MKLLSALLGLIGQKNLVLLLDKICKVYATGRSATEALRFLFDLDNRLYLLQGAMAVAYGNGMHTKHRHTKYHDFFVERVHTGERVLDIGCGSGAVAYAVADRSGACVVAFDIDLNNIAKANELFAHQNVTYIVGDALGEIPDEKFDVIILSNVLEHLTERVFFLRRVKQVCPAGRFLIRVPIFERDWRVPLKRELGVEWRLDTTHETEYTLESFIVEVNEAGLVVTHMEIRCGEIWSELCAK